MVTRIFHSQKENVSCRDVKPTTEELQSIDDVVKKVTVIGYRVSVRTTSYIHTQDQTIIRYATGEGSSQGFKCGMRVMDDIKH
jgi:hypothetical protein